MFDPTREQGSKLVTIAQARKLQHSSKYLINWRPDESLPEEQQYAIVWNVEKRRKHAVLLPKRRAKQPRRVRRHV